MSTRHALSLGSIAAGVALAAIGLPAASAGAAVLGDLDTVVVIYAENRSFDHLYGRFPGANGLQALAPADVQQSDRDGRVLAELPPVWGGLNQEITEAATRHLPNRPFALDDPDGFDLALGALTTDPVHRFYQSRMQINGGRNDRFVAYTDVGALVMGTYDGAKLPTWGLAERYTLADNFFMAAFGGSFLNHFWLVCACTPSYPDADRGPARHRVSAVGPDGVTLRLAPESPGSALDGPPRFVDEDALTPDFYAVNTMQPPFQPSEVGPAPGGDPAYADPSQEDTLPPQTAATIGDLLSARGISWAWYAGAWQAALDGRTVEPEAHFQAHHQPFNYFAAFAPGTAARAEHLRDGGLDGSAFINAIDRGELPQVAFYKPQGSLNKHAGYGNALAGDRHIAEVVARLERSPQWPRMLVIVTYDENGGFWDHVGPPRGDRWGPGSRVPALIISPFAKRGHVDHTPYDTTSILRFLTRRFDLPTLSGIAGRDAALAANGHPPMGDLTDALALSPERAGPTQPQARQASE